MQWEPGLTAERHVEMRQEIEARRRDREATARRRRDQWTIAVLTITLMVGATIVAALIVGAASFLR